MYRLHAILYAHLDDRINVEICGHGGFVTGEFERLVCLVPMLGESILTKNIYACQIYIKIGLLVKEAYWGKRKYNRPLIYIMRYKYEPEEILEKGLKINIIPTNKNTNQY